MNIYEQVNIHQFTKCVDCGERAWEIAKQYDDYSIEDSSFSSKLGGWICFPCKESNEEYMHGTVIIFDPQEQKIWNWRVMGHEDMYGVERYNGSLNLEEYPDLHPYDYDDEGSPIQFKYVRTDAWRGYYSPTSEEYSNFHSDCILSGSYDSDQLKEFDIAVKQALWDMGVRFAVVFGRTSNLFSCGYDMMINKNDLDLTTMMEISSKLALYKIMYRDDRRFRITALTGKSDPEEFDEKDDLLLEASDKIMKGEDFKQIQAEILEKLKTINDGKP